MISSKINGYSGRSSSSISIILKMFCSSTKDCMLVVNIFPSFQALVCFCIRVCVGYFMPKSDTFSKLISKLTSYDAFLYSFTVAPPLIFI